jgi:heat shock protein HslJ
MLFVVVGMSMTACGSDDPQSPGPSDLDLVGRTFLSDNVMVNDEPFPLAKGSALRVSFDTDRIGASAGCNSMGGTASWTDGTLRVDAGSLATTEMACEEPLMKQDVWFSKFLTSSPTMAQDADSLVMTSGDTVIVMTDEEVVVPDAQLTGSEWVLDSITTGSTVSSVPSGVTSTVRFGSDGVVTVQLGCNSGSGPYTDSGDVLSVGPLVTTKMACQPPAADVESAVDSVLDGDVSYTIDGNALVLTPTRVTGSNNPDGLTYRVD